ncbi:rRNA maturation RNase YbeY [soil metagenome]
MRVEVIDETDRFRHPEVLERALSRLGRELGAGERDVTIVLVDDETIAARNLADRDVEGPTDVLAYPLHEPDDVGLPIVPTLGDILISLDTAERQAPDHGLDTRQEVLVLAAHGLTHLLGHDHPDPDSWSAFETAQARVLELTAEDDHG